MDAKKDDGFLIDWDLLNIDFETEEKTKKKNQVSKIEVFLEKFKDTFNDYSGNYKTLDIKALSTILNSEEFINLSTIEESFSVEHSKYMNAMKNLVNNLLSHNVYNAINAGELTHFKNLILRTNNEFITEKMNFWELAALLEKTGIDVDKQSPFFERWFERTGGVKKYVYSSKEFLNEKDALKILNNLNYLGVSNIFSKDYNIQILTHDYYKDYHNKFESNNDLCIKIIDITMKMSQPVVDNNPLEIELKKAININEFTKNCDVERRIEITNYLMKNVKIKELYHEFLNFNNGFTSILNKPKDVNCDEYNGLLNKETNIFLNDDLRYYKKTENFCKLIKLFDKDVIDLKKQKKEENLNYWVKENEGIVKLMNTNINLIKKMGISEYQGNIMNVNLLINEPLLIKKLKTVLVRIESKIKEKDIDINNIDEIKNFLKNELGKGNSNKIIINDISIDVDKLSSGLSMSKSLLSKISPVYELEYNINQYNNNKSKIKELEYVVSNMQKIEDLDIKFFEENYDKLILWNMINDYSATELQVFGDKIRKTGVRHNFIARKFASNKDFYRKGLCGDKELKEVMQYIFEKPDDFNNFFIDSNLEYLTVGVIDNSDLIKYIDLNKKVNLLSLKINKMKMVLDRDLDENKQLALDKEELKLQKMKSEIISLNFDNDKIDNEFRKITCLLEKKEKESGYSESSIKIRNFILEHKIKENALEVDEKLCEQMKILGTYMESNETMNLLNKIRNLKVNANEEDITSDRVKVVFLYKMLGYGYNLERLLVNNGIEDKETIKEEMIKNALSSKLLLKKVGNDLFLEEDLLNIINKPSLWQDRKFVLNYLREIDNNNMIFLAFLASAPSNVKTVIHNWHMTGINCESFFQKAELEQKLNDTKRIDSSNSLVRNKKKI